MAKFANLLLFGDQAVKPHPSVRALYRRAKRSLFLSNFLRSSADALRAAVARLGNEDRRRFGTFDTLLDLSEIHSDVRDENGVNDAAVSTVLLCVVQLGWLLARVESDPSILAKDDCSRTILLGFCTGMLPAVAAAASTCLSELLRLAPEIVCLSLRLGLEVSHRSRRLEHSTAGWATVLSGVSVDCVQAALQQFHDTQQIPQYRQAYISAVYPYSVTVSGPPSTLTRLFLSSPELSNVRKTKLPIGAAYHACHLDTPDLDAIIGRSPIFDINIPSNACILSTSSGEPITGTPKIRDLLSQALLDILQLPLDWPTVVEKVVSMFERTDIVLSPIGPTNLVKPLQNALGPARVRVIADDGAPHDTYASSQPNESGAIAIVGMSGRFPGAVTLEEFWDVLEHGLDLHKKVPADRFDVRSHCNPTGKAKNTTLTPYGCFMDRPDLFDASLFNMSPREAAQTDPMQRLILMTTYEALEMAGYSHDRTPASNRRRIGTFFGQTSDDWREVNASQDIDCYFITGGNRAFGPGRINYHFGWEGPSVSLDTACSSSSTAIQVACSALLSRECDMAVAGGASILTASDIFAGLSRGSFLSLTGSCKTFDSEADGYCRADAVGTILLKRLEDAVADRDNIKAVIRSVITNHSAEAVSITHPHVESQERLFRRVLQDACVAPEEIDYVEMHGTGTQAGDVLESKSVTNVFARDRERDNPLFIGTVKPNVGHSEAASGVTSVIKAMMMLRKSLIPPHVGIKNRMNENLPPFAALNTHIARVKTPFNARPDGDGKRRIVVNNFDAAGGNTSMLLEDPPTPTVQGEDPRSAHVVTISARTPNALRQNVRRLCAYLDGNEQIKLSDLSYTTTARRLHHVLRKSYSAISITDLAAQITKDLADFKEPERINKAPSVAFAFTGQGSLHAGMGKALFETSSVFRDSILTSEAISRKHGFPSFLELITNPELDLTKYSPVQSQLGQVALELALAALWQSWGIQPDVVVGHSLGEYPALCVSGILSVTDMLYLVGKRAELMQGKCTPGSHAMLAVQSPREPLQQALLDLNLASCEVACINNQNSTVISGRVEEIRMLCAHLQRGGVKTKVLEVPFAFHSAQIDPILNEYEVSARNVYFGKPVIPFASTLLSIPITEQGVVNARYLAQQARDPVNFWATIENCRNQGIVNNKTTWFEIGPSPVCLAMVRPILETAAAQSLASLKPNEENWLTLSRSIATAYNNGLDIRWGDFHREYEGALSLLELPSYAFDLKSYWIQYEGDWAIRKCDRVSATSLPFSTTVLQSIESESITEDGASVTFKSNLADPELRDAVLGHMVNGSGLCSGALYAAMALTASSYIHTRTETSLKVPAMDVCNMEILQPLIVKLDNATQMVRVTAVKNSESNSVQISVASQDGHQAKIHARCSIRYGDGDGWMSSWTRNAYLIKSRIDYLMDSANASKINRLLKNMVYKLFSSLVKYDKNYQGIQEVFMDSNLLEAAATVKFPSTHAEGTFPYNPYWIDSIAHLSGFVLNGNDTTDEDVAYICHGWESMRIACPLSEDNTYVSYVRMQPAGARGHMAGDVYVFNDDKIVGICGGVKFQQVKRTVLNSLLPRDAARPLLQAPKPARSECPAAPASAEIASFPREPSFSQILSSIASEIGVDVSELFDTANFFELGVDSLLTIAILERLREETHLDLPSSLFATYPTVCELRKYFHQTLQIEQDSFSSGSSDICSDNDSVLSKPLSTGTSTPASGIEDVFDTFRNIIAAEIGVDVGEIQPGMPLADLGVDSLLSLSIISAINLETGLSLPSSFFHDHPTFDDIQRVIGSLSLPSLDLVNSKIIQKPGLRSTSVLLQGDSSRPGSSLFLLPDGSGSACSYVNLPSFDLGIAVFGLNSPFQTSPLDYTISLQTVAQIYVSEILQRRPHGPYILGGWSIGGIYAYEVANQLIARGEVVTGLILIDAPCPKVVPPLPVETLEVLERIGVFDCIKMKDRSRSLDVRQHFLKSIGVLNQYIPSPVDPSRPPPKCLVIWAREGVWESVGSDGKERLLDRQATNNKAHDWLMDPRQSYGPNGWEELLPQVDCTVVDGNHFTIMRRPQVEALGPVITTALRAYLRGA